MSNSSALSMNELLNEGAELLPGRETLFVPCAPHNGGVWGFAQTGAGNTAQSGLLNVALLNGSLNGLTIGHIL